jgi:small subunit ribosomal protein S15
LAAGGGRNCRKELVSALANRSASAAAATGTRAQRTRRRLNAGTAMPLTIERKQQLKGEFGRSASDSGSPEVQIALLTSRIAQMTEHMQLHPKDYASRRGLLGMVSRRRRLLDYLKRIKPELYLELLRRLEIRK